MLILAVCLMGGAGLRSLGAPFLAVMAAISLAYAGREVFAARNAPVLLLTGWGLIYVALSYLNLLPGAWTRHHEVGIISQQASFLFLLLPVIAASQKWWSDEIFERSRHKILLLCVVFVFVLNVPVRIYVFGDMESLFESFKQFETLQNDVMIAFIALTYITFMRGGGVISGTVILLAVLVSSVAFEARFQNVLVYFVGFSVFLMHAIKLPLERAFVVLVAFAVVCVAIFGMINPASLFALDPNTGWRAIFWRDGLEAMIRTWGVGVGFGTEALRNEYRLIVDRAFFLPEEDVSFLLVGTHNGFVDVAFRLGVVGVILWTAAVLRCFPVAVPPGRSRAHAAVVFFAIFMCIFTNVALQSPLYAIGVAFGIGYLQSVRSLEFGTIAAVARPRYQPAV